MLYSAVEQHFLPLTASQWLMGSDAEKNNWKLEHLQV